ncbi:MAG: TrkA family potassium uptake protein [Bacteroidetes bacterium]|nr:TrkA family potassium uptake protein [Bacteroidota bacterium]MBT7143008.1 TrkA family potassium uptake protein [Bacteroidota bacterium]
MKYAKFTKYIIWILLIIYLILIWQLVRFESSNPNSNIKNIYDGLWYSVITLTTVGYGDFYPVTPAGKILGLIIVLSSLGLLGYLIGNLTNKIRNYMESKKHGHFGVDFENHFIIFAWDRFGHLVTDQIIKAQKKVAIVTNNKNDVETIYELFGREKVFVFYSDYDNFEAFKKINIEKASSVFINFTDDTETLVQVINLKKFYSNIKFVVSLDKPDLKETYHAIGVTYAISKNEIASKLVASYIFEPDVAHITEDLMATTIDKDDYDIQEYKVTTGNPYLNHDYLQSFIDLKKTYDCVMIGISKYNSGNRELLKNPTEGVNIEQNDYLIIMSNGNTKKMIEASFGIKEGRSD